MCYECSFVSGLSGFEPGQDRCNDPFTGGEFISNCSGVVCRKNIVLSGSKWAHRICFFCSRTHIFKSKNCKFKNISFIFRESMHAKAALTWLVLPCAVCHSIPRCYFITVSIAAPSKYQPPLTYPACSAHLLTILQLVIQVTLELLSMWQEINLFHYVRFFYLSVLITSLRRMFFSSKGLLMFLIHRNLVWAYLSVSFIITLRATFMT